MLLSYNKLCELVERGVIEHVTPDLINGSSIDITLGSKVLVEERPEFSCPKCGDVITNRLGSLSTQQDRDVRMVCTPCGYQGPYHTFASPVDIASKETINMSSCHVDNGFTLWPGHSILASSVQVFNLPDNITAEYRLKSSMARVFLEHLHAGWCDPLWQGSVLTLELTNMCRHHPLLLKEGMKCGQVCFYEHEPVPHNMSYAVRGSYNNDKEATPSKGLK